MADFVLGMNAKIYYGTAGALLAALTELTNAKDVTLNLSAGEADITTRANSGWKASAPTLRECSVDFEMVWKPADPGFEALKAAYLANGTVELAILDGSKSASDSQGPKGSFGITSFSRSEPLAEALTVKVTAKLATWDEWVEVA